MENRHSGFGIASFLISLAAGAFMFALLLAVLIMRAALSHQVHGGVENTARFLFGLLLLGFFLTELLALGLGIAGCVQADRKKLFAILGVAFSAIPLLVGTVALIVAA